MSFEKDMRQKDTDMLIKTTFKLHNFCMQMVQILAAYW